jgi:cytoskeleton-associated protein 5
MDDVPIGGKGAYAIPESELPDDSTEVESGPLESRLESKVWKTRALALEELAKLLRSEDSPPFDQFLSGVHKYIGDSNPGAQEKGIDVLSIYIEKRPDMITSVSEDLVKNLVEKGVANMKTNIKNASLENLLNLFGAHTGNFEPFVNGLLSSLNNKNVKVQAAGASSVAAVMLNFGVQYLPIKPFLAPMEKLAGSTNPQVRAEVMNFFKEAYRWIRDAINPTVEKLKPAQAKELQTAFAEITEPAAPLRAIRGKSLPVPGSKDSKAQGAPVIDAYDLAEPKDIFKKYNEAWCNGVLGMEKWIDKKNALEELNNEANVPKLADKNPAEIAGMAKRLLNDNNVNVNMQAIKLIGVLAKGLRKSFDGYARQFVPILLQKFKDKKNTIVSEAHTALDNLLKSTTFESILEDVKEALDDKTPALKTNVMQLIDRTMAGLPDNNRQRLAPQIAAMCKHMTEDSNPDVRKETVKLLTVLATYNEEAEKFVQGLAPSKVKQLEKTAGPSKQRAPSVEPEEKKSVDKAPKRTANKTSTTAPAPAKKAQPGKANTVAPSQPGGKAGSSEPQEEDPTSNLTIEDALQIIEGLIPGDTFNLLKESAWKEKLTGLQNLLQWMQENDSLIGDKTEVLIRFVKYVCKEWKENNFNLIKQAFEVIAWIAQNLKINRKAASIAINSQAIEKLGDTKVASAYYELINKLCEIVSPKFVMGQIMKHTADCNKPKLVAECCNVFGKLMGDYSVATMNLKEVIDYAKNCLNATNPTIKKGGQSLLVIIYSNIGESITALLSDVKEATMKVLQEEFSKTTVNLNKEYKSVRGMENVKIPSDPRSILDEALPRANISAALNSKLVEKISDSNWKLRKEGCEAVEAILEQNGMRIMPTGLRDLFKALEGRMNEPNKSLLRGFLSLVIKLAEAIGNECKQYSKFIMPGLLNNLADKQTLVRQEALAAIDKWAHEAGAEYVISYSCEILKQENPELRSELINWLLAHKDSLPKVDLNPMIPSLISCLQDKSAGIRNSAEILFADVIEQVGYNALKPHLKNIRPAFLSTLQPIFDKYRNETGEKEAEPVPAEPQTKSLKPPPPRGAKPATAANTSTLRARPKTQGSRASNEAELNRSPQRKSPVPGQSASSPMNASILGVGNKDKRLDYDSKSKWSVDEIRPDHLEKLREYLTTCFSQELFNLMFAKDFKKQMEAVQHLERLLASQRNVFIDTLDLIFKWIWVKLQEMSNTQLVKSVLELDEKIITALSDEGYALNDIEASLFLPILCDKSGHNNTVFRTMIRSIIHSSTKIYNPSKVFNIVLQGLSSKNTRSKVECMEELSALVVDFGMSVSQPRDIKAIAKFVNSADNNVRNAAVGAMAEIYKFTSEKIWQIIGDVPDKVKDMLEQRFKSVSGSKSISRPSTAPNKPEPSKVTTPRGAKLKFTFEEDRKEKQDLSSSMRLDSNPVKKLNMNSVRGEFENLSVTDREVRDTRLPDSIKKEKRSSVILDVSSETPKTRTTVSKTQESKIGRSRCSTPGDRSPVGPRNTDYSILSEFSTPQAPIIDIEKEPEPIYNENKPEQKKVVDKPKDMNTPRFTKEDEKERSVLETLVTSPNVHVSESLLYEPIKLDEIFTDLDQHIETLREGDMSSKVDALVAINDMLLNSSGNFKDELIQKSNQIVDAFCLVIKNTFDRNLEEIPLRFAKYFCNVVHKVCSTRIVMKELTDAALFNLIEQLLLKLLIENLEKLGERGEGKEMQGTINASILKMLENCQFTRVFVVLIRLLTKYKGDNNVPKMPGVIIRCLLKMTKVLNSVIKYLDVDKILVAMHEYLIENKLGNSNDEIGVKSIKTILNELVKLLNEKIWDYYEPVRRHQTRDSLLEGWITRILQTMNSYTISSVSSPRSKPDDGPLGDLFSRLAIESFYSEAFKELIEYTEKNTVDLVPYMSKLSPELYERVTEDLRRSKEEAKQPPKDLKDSKPQMQANNFQEFQNRIAMMKQRYGIDNQASSATSNIADLKAKVNSLLNRQGSTETSDFGQLRERIEQLKK